MLLNAEPMRPPTIIIAPAIPAMPSPYPEWKINKDFSQDSKGQMVLTSSIFVVVTNGSRVRSGKFK